MSTFQSLRQTLTSIDDFVDVRLFYYARASARRIKENAQSLVGHDQPFWLGITEETRTRRQGNHDAGPLLDTEALRDAIAVVVAEFPSAHHATYTIGVDEAATSTHATAKGERTVPVAQYAMVQEFGSEDGHTPARPFLRPALMMELGNLSKFTRIALREGVADAIRSGGRFAGMERVSGTIPRGMDD